jgi:monoamine oxidase
MDEYVYDVIVIGAGISGLYAARCLKEEGLKFGVLESSDRVGGRTWTLRDIKTGGYVDMGGAYFGCQQKKVIRLAKELGLEFYNVPDRGKTTLKYKGKVGHYDGDIPPAGGVFQLLDLVSVIKELDRLSLEVPLFQPWKASLAPALDSVSVMEFLEKFCWTGFAKSMVEIGLSAVFGHACSKVSLLYALHLIRSCGGTRALFDQKKGGLQEMKLIGGSDSISLRMAKELGCKLRQCSSFKALILLHSFDLT